MEIGNSHLLGVQLESIFFVSGSRKIGVLHGVHFVTSQTLINFYFWKLVKRELCGNGYKIS
ncbi:hypothetical protein MTR67_048188 [Solanum verrucosum]|uniref:Uncharacterized protein n=1 Tax=Solanum verrucosum TaxID=315347 RepID=A0AAF0UXH7_SOLVR|nr:hypothetical protein MTR67_048188 [Solanum verrucosum]